MFDEMESVQFTDNCDVCKRIIGQLPQFLVVVQAPAIFSLPQNGDFEHAKSSQQISTKIWLD